MSRANSSFFPAVLIAFALVLAGYFALFGSNQPVETLPGVPAPETASAPSQPVTEPSAVPTETEPSAPFGSAPPVAAVLPPEEPRAGLPVPASHQGLEKGEVETLCRAGDWISARATLSKLFPGTISDRDRRWLADRAVEINQRLLVREPDANDVTIHVLKTGELLTHVAKKYPQLHNEWGILAVVNNIADPHRLRAGKKLRIPKGTWSLTVDKSLFRMWLLYEGAPFKEYVVAIGSPQHPTPAATFTVRSKSPKPAWTPPADTGLKGQIPYGHKDNPLGEYWIALEHDTFDGFGIHGTNDESVIGTAASRGCVRMHNSEVVEMASIAFPGMPLTVVE